jgi:hypothetical protein
VIADVAWKLIRQHLLCEHNNCRLYPHANARYEEKTTRPKLGSQWVGARWPWSIKKGPQQTAAKSWIRLLTHNNMMWPSCICFTGGYLDN